MNSYTNNPVSISIHPIVVPSGTSQSFIVEGLSPNARYTLVISSVRKPDDIDTIQVIADDLGMSYWQHRINWNGEALCNVLAGDEDSPLAILHLFAVSQAIYELQPLRCDFHVHTVFSDGTATPIEMAIRGRELGLDVLAITDHNYYASSIEAIDFVNKTGMQLVCLPGEEVSAPDWHILSINARGQVSTKGVTPGFKGAETSVQNVHDLGGLAVLAHPFWTINQKLHLPTDLYHRIVTDRMVDAIELLGDVTLDENIRSLAHYYELPEQLRLPILGNSDTHRLDHTYGGYWTFVLSQDKTPQSIIDAILDHHSVACLYTILAPPGGHPTKKLVAFGAFELVDLVLFLDQHYFPEHDDLCKQEAAIARQVLLNEIQQPASTELCEISQKIERHFRCYWQGGCH